MSNQEDRKPTYEELEKALARLGVEVMRLENIIEKKSRELISANNIAEKLLTNAQEKFEALENGSIPKHYIELMVKMLIGGGGIPLPKSFSNDNGLVSYEVEKVDMNEFGICIDVSYFSANIPKKVVRFWLMPITDKDFKKDFPDSHYGFKKIKK